MSKPCTTIMNQFLELDKNQQLPFKTTLHLLTCKHCRTQVRLMTMAEKYCKEPLVVPAEDSTQAIITLMQKIDSNYLTETPVAPISLRRWIVCGITMILGMLFFIFHSIYIDSIALNVTFYCFFACAISAYCAIFVGSNMDFFVKKIETLNEHNLVIKNL